MLALGDCEARLRELPDACVDSIVTDPPYGLAFMGKRWDYDVPSEAIWRECLRVLKLGGYLLAFAGTRTYHRMVVRIEDAGFEIRDQIAWVYGSGFPKSKNLDGDWQGWGTALKPALEPICVARKPLIGTVAANVLEHGTGALNIDGCRIATNPDVDDSRLGGQGTWNTGKMAKNVYEGGYAGETVGSSPLGRWPANLIHDGSDEVLALFPETASGTGAVKRQTGTGYAPNALGRESRAVGTPNIEYGDRGSAGRFFYCAKTSKKDRDEGLDAFAEKPWVQWQTANGTSGKASSLSEGRDTSYRNSHPTVKPTDLMRYLCRLVTPPGGIVLDPFMGSGSTGKAARLEGFRFAGVEREADYLRIAEARIAHVSADVRITYGF